MILNEDYFDDLEIKNEDIVDDIEEPEPELTVEYVCDLPKHYNQVILFNVINTEISDKELITKTTLLPKIYKRLDTIFELYGIEHSEYILTSFHAMYAFETSVKFGNYLLFCVDYEKDRLLNGEYSAEFYIRVFVNYPEFNYKKAFRFIYTMINIFRLGQISRIKFEPTLPHLKNDELLFLYTDKGVVSCDAYNIEKENVNLYTKKQKPENKKKFYKRVVRHFIGQILGDIDYDAIDRDVPLKPIRF